MEQFRIIKFQKQHKKSGLSHHSTPPQHNTNHQQKRNITTRKPHVNHRGLNKPQK